MSFGSTAAADIGREDQGGLGKTRRGTSHGTSASSAASFSTSTHSRASREGEEERGREESLTDFDTHETSLTDSTVSGVSFGSSDGTPPNAGSVLRMATSHDGGTVSGRKASAGGGGDSAHGGTHSSDQPGSAKHCFLVSSNGSNDHDAKRFANRLQFRCLNPELELELYSTINKQQQETLAARHLLEDEGTAKEGVAAGEEGVAAREGAGEGDETGVEHLTRMSETLSLSALDAAVSAVETSTAQREGTVQKQVGEEEEGGEKQQEEEEGKKGEEEPPQICRNELAPQAVCAVAEPPLLPQTVFAGAFATVQAKEDY
jgi:hypothetical protein